MSNLQNDKKDIDAPKEFKSGTLLLIAVAILLVPLLIAGFLFQ
jgi:hypothetical protein